MHIVYWHYLLKAFEGFTFELHVTKFKSILINSTKSRFKCLDNKETERINVAKLDLARGMMTVLRACVVDARKKVYLVAVENKL